MFHRDTTFGGYCLKHLALFPCKTCAMEQVAAGRDMPAIVLGIKPPNRMIEMSKYEDMVAKKDFEIARLRRMITNAIDGLQK